MFSKVVVHFHDLFFETYFPLLFFGKSNSGICFQIIFLFIGKLIALSGDQKGLAVRVHGKLKS